MRLPKTIIKTVINGKGGQGKSRLLINGALRSALRGKHVVVVDLDNVYSCTAMAARSGAEELKNFIQVLQKNARTMTVQRLLLQPELGFAGIDHEFPLRDMLMNLERIKRYPSSKIETKGLLNKTLDAYHIDLNHLGTLRVVPNSGPLAEFIEYLIDDRGLTNYLLRDAIAIALEVYGQQGYTVPDEIWLDTPGDINTTPRIAAFAADQIFVPFIPQPTGILGVMETYNQVISALRSDSMYDNQTSIMAAVPNAVRVGDEEVEMFLNTYASDQLGAYTLITNHYRIAKSTDESASMSIALPFEYNPFDPSVVSTWEYLEYVERETR